MVRKQNIKLLGETIYDVKNPEISRINTKQRSEFEGNKLIYCDCAYVSEEIIKKQTVRIEKRRHWTIDNKARFKYGIGKLDNKSTCRSVLVQRG